MGRIHQILVPIVTGKTIPSRLRSREEILPRRLKFTDHHRNPLADILVNQLLKARVHHAFFTPGGVVSWGAGIGIMVSRSPEVGSAHTLRLREIERRVVMIFHHQAVGNHVRRQGIQPGRVATGLQHQPAVGVVATHCPHRVDKRLVIIHQRVHRGGAGHGGFVTGGKQQMVVVAGKGGGNLGPVSLHLRVDDWIHACPNVLLQPAIVPVIVDHDIHARRDGRVHRLFDLRHVSGTDHVVGDAAADVGAGGHVPRARNAHGVEPVLDGRVEQRRVGRTPVQLQLIANIHPIAWIRPRRGRRNVGAHRLKTQIENRVKLVAAAGGDGAAADGNQRNFAASVGVVCGHGQCRIAAAARLDAESIRVGLVRAQPHIQPAPFQPVAVGETGIRRADREEQRRRAAAHRIYAQIIRRRGRGRAVAAPGIQSPRLDGDRHEPHRIGAGGERLTRGRTVVGVVIEAVRLVRVGRVAQGRELVNVVRARTWRSRSDVRKRLRV